ncbi:MAG: DciA family protein [Gammaproteobacteria bacterium]
MRDRARRPKSLAKVLNDSDSGVLGELLAHTRRLREIDQRLAACLPADLAPHCRVADYRDRSLTLGADSPLWASRLRFGVPVIQAALGLDSRCSVRVRVLIPVTDPQQRRRPRPSISSASRAWLRHTAELTEDAALRAAWLKLAGRGYRP